MLLTLLSGPYRLMASDSKIGREEDEPNRFS